MASSTRTVYPGSVLLLEVDHTVKKFVKTQRKKQTAKQPESPRKKFGERVSGGLLPLLLPAKPSIAKNSPVQIGIFPSSQGSREVKNGGERTAPNTIRQVCNVIRSREENVSPVIAPSEVVAPASSPRDVSTLAALSVEQKSLPLVEGDCCFSPALCVQAGQKLLAEMNIQNASPGFAAVKVAKAFKAVVFDSEDNNEETVKSEVRSVDREVDQLGTVNGVHSSTIESTEFIPRILPADASNKRRYGGIRRAVFLVDREPTISFYHGRQRPKSSNILLGISGQPVVPIGRSPVDDDKALRHLLQVENAIDSALHQLHMALHTCLDDFIYYIGRAPRTRSFVTLSQTTIELDIPEESVMRSPLPTKQPVRVKSGSGERASQSYRRKTRPFTAATATGLEVIGTSAEVSKLVVPPIPFCFARQASTPTSTSDVQFIFIPNYCDESSSEDCLESTCLSQSDVVFKSWAVLWGFRRTAISKAAKLAVLEYVGVPGATVSGKLYIVPTAATIRFLASLRRLHDSSDQFDIALRGVAIVPVWTSLSNDPCLAANCLLSLVAFFDCKQR